MSTKPYRFIAYAVQQFPSLRTTFIRREIDSLRSLGLPIEVVSMRPVDVKDIEQEIEARPHLRSTRFLPRHPAGIRSIASNVRAFIRWPVPSIKNAALCFENAEDRGWLPRLRLLLQVWRGATMACELRRIGKCEHIHAHFADGAATTSLACARLLSIGFSFSSHTSRSSPALQPKLREAQFIRSISEFDRQRLLGLAHGAVAPIYVVRYGLNTDEWQFAPKPTYSNPPRLLSIGALIEKKGHDILIRACGELARAGEKFTCRIIGGGPLRQQLQKEIETEGLADHVLLLGPLPQAKVRTEMAQADIFALACKEAVNGDVDGLPNVIIEAMASGVPVVSTFLVGIPEVVQHERSGFLAEPGNPLALAQQIQRLLNRDVDRTMIIENARKQVERLHYEPRISSELLQLFQLAASVDVSPVS